MFRRYQIWLHSSIHLPHISWPSFWLTTGLFSVQPDRFYHRCLSLSCMFAQRVNVWPRQTTVTQPVLVCSTFSMARCQALTSPNSAHYGLNSASHTNQVGNRCHRFAYCIYLCHKVVSVTTVAVPSIRKWVWHHRFACPNREQLLKILKPSDYL